MKKKLLIDEDENNAKKPQPVESLVQVLTIPGLKAELHFNGTHFSITGTTDGDAYELVKQALQHIKSNKKKGA